MFSPFRIHTEEDGPELSEKSVLDEELCKECSHKQVPDHGQAVQQQARVGGAGGGQ